MGPRNDDDERPSYAGAGADAHEVRTVDVTIAKVTDAGDDVLVVEGTVDGEPVTARGWVSAMTNHYDDDTRDEAGHRDESAQPRAMTDDERRDYWLRLLTAAAPAARVLYESETP